ncbi:aerobic cobaltochelatase subunit CobS, partial [Vibrio lentus]|nr:aerobic cobaltochelatase subunit CobS [Vibrio lentus]
MMKEAELVPTQPVSVRERFGIDSNLTVMAFEHPGEYVPKV